MRIALYGNICNNMYAIARALKQNSGIDVHLYLADNLYFNNLPENDDPELANNYPFWIHRGKQFRISSLFYFWKNNIVKELNKYDLVVLSSIPVFLAPLLKTQTVFYVTGSDLTLLPFRKLHRTLFYKGKKNNIKPVLYEWWVRKAIKKVNKLIILPFRPMLNAAEKLEIPESKILNAYFPILFNTDLFSYRPDAWQRMDEHTRKKMEKFKFRIFHPSRIIVDNHPHLVETGQWKQNDLLLKAFALFVKKHNIKDAAVYLIEREYGKNEVAKFKEIIKELDIEEFVIWLKPANKSGFTRDELINIYSVCDVITDDYGAGWFGSICIEGFSCSKPVLSYVDEEAMAKIYPWHPFLSSHTAGGNQELIEKLYFNPDFASQQGQLGRKWAEEFHSFKSIGPIYVREFEKLVTGMKTNNA